MRNWHLCLVGKDKWRERGASGEVTAPNWLQSGLGGEGPKGALDQKPGMVGVMTTRLVGRWKGG